MENILYLDDYINLYLKKENKILMIKPYKDTLENGKIINREKFIKKMNKVLKERKINNFFNGEVTVIINSLINIEDKKILEYCLNELNYKKIYFIREIKYLKINQDNLFINCNETYFYFYYNDFRGNTKIKVYENDEMNREVLNKIIKFINKKEIYLYGKNINEIVEILNKEKVNYYYYEDSSNLIINLTLL